MMRGVFLQTATVGATPLAGLSLRSAFAAEKPNWPIGCLNARGQSGVRRGARRHCGRWLKTHRLACGAQGPSIGSLRKRRWLLFEDVLTLGGVMARTRQKVITKNQNSAPKSKNARKTQRDARTERLCSSRSIVEQPKNLWKDLGGAFATVTSIDKIRGSADGNWRGGAQASR